MIMPRLTRIAGATATLRCRRFCDVCGALHPPANLPVFLNKEARRFASIIAVIS
jgi:hypothetical protein